MDLSLTTFEGMFVESLPAAERGKSTVPRVDKCNLPKNFPRTKTASAHIGLSEHCEAESR